MDARLQHRVQRYGWDKAASACESGWRDQLVPAQSALIDSVRWRPGQAVLGIACGTGLVTLQAAAIAMQAAVRGITLARLEVAVHSESDARGLFGRDDVSAALSNLRMEVTIGAPDASAQQLEQLVAWAEAHSPVSGTLLSDTAVRLQIQVV